MMGKRPVKNVWLEKGGILLIIRKVGCRFKSCRVKIIESLWKIDIFAQETLRKLDYWKRQMPKDFTIKLCEEYLKQKLSNV